MKVTFFSTQPYDRVFFDKHNTQGEILTIEYLDPLLNEQTVLLVHDSQAICVFVNDKVTRPVIETLAKSGVKIIALRCAGFNNVDLVAAKENNIRVVRVPSYSPHAVAEHAVAMILTLNRKLHKAYNRVREQNFSLSGLMGFDLFGKTIGVIGTGNIGHVFATIMLGFGCKVIAYDVVQDATLTKAGVTYVALDEVLSQSDILSLHCPLNDKTRYLIDTNGLNTMRKGAMLINTSRGGLIHTTSVIQALKSGQLGALGIDVYEQEESLFFRDLSGQVLEDDIIGRLVSFHNVLITAHQGFFTQEALDQIAGTTLASLKDFNSGAPLMYEVKLP